MESLPLSGQVAAITGASSGIGAATARALAAAGAAVSLAARREDRIAALADEIRAAGGRALARPTDVTDADAARAFVAATREELGGLDVLVNNAGVMLLAPALMGDEIDWRAMLDVNLAGMVNCTHAAVPGLVEQQRGHIVNVASLMGRTTTVGTSAYSLTKYGVVGYSDALRREMLHAGVRVTVIEPGYVDTELHGHNTLPAVVSTLERDQAKAGKLLEAGDVAEAIAFAVTRPAHVSVNEVLLRPTGQQL